MARHGFPFNGDDSFLRNVGGLTGNSLNHILQIHKFNESLPDGELEIIKHSSSGYESILSSRLIDSVCAHTC